MQNLTLSRCRASYLSMPFMKHLLFIGFILFSSQLSMISAQAKLSIQGILKKANGEAVPDDTYNLTFRLYTSLNAPVNQNIWTETQPSVEVVSGIYSTVLGNVTALTVPFNVDYFLGVSVNSGTEMTPRIQLTSAPYALSLRGQNNQFPSSGIVIADSIRVNGGVLARGGAPGMNGSNKNGFAFVTNNGDKDSGLFSTALGQVSLYVNNAPMLTASPDSVAIRSDLRLNNGGNINYNGQNDWRLVDTDYFEANEDGWKKYTPSDPQNPLDGWKSTNGTNLSVTTFNDAFAGKAIVNTAQGQVFKKKFTLPGSSTAGTYTYIKVVFNYFFLNSWDGGEPDVGWGAFSKTENCSELSVAWVSGNTTYTSAGHWLGNNQGQFGPAANFVNGDQGNDPAQWSDQWRTEEMVARYPSGAGNADFWVIFGDASNEGVGTENFAISMVEIWVK